VALARKRKSCVLHAARRWRNAAATGGVGITTITGAVVHVNTGSRGNHLYDVTSMRRMIQPTGFSLQVHVEFLAVAGLARNIQEAVLVTGARGDVCLVAAAWQARSPVPRTLQADRRRGHGSRGPKPSISDRFLTFWLVIGLALLTDPFAGSFPETPGYTRSRSVFTSR
jgi:hypothetical protein